MNPKKVANKGLLPLSAAYEGLLEEGESSGYSSIGGGFLPITIYYDVKKPSILKKKRLRAALLFALS